MSRVLGFRRVGTVALIAVSTAIVSASSMAAQSVGELVRVTRGGDRIVGTVANVDDSALTINLASGGSSLRISSAEIAAIERSLGTRSHRRLGFLIGASGGVVAAAGTAFLFDDFLGSGAGLTTFALGSVVWGGGLGLTGFLVGSFIRSERWEPIPTTTMGGFSMSPILGFGFGGHGQPQGPFLGGRIRF